MGIRQAGQQDAEAISAVAVETYIDAFSHYFDAAQDLETSLQNRSPEYFLRTMNENPVTVIEDNGAIKGFCQIGPVDPRIKGAAQNHKQIKRLYIHPDEQGKGFGKALFNETLRHPFLKNTEKIFLEVWEESHAAIKIYTGAGFKKHSYLDVVVNGKTLGQDLVMVLER